MTTKTNSKTTKNTKTSNSKTDRKAAIKKAAQKVAELKKTQGKSPSTELPAVKTPAPAPAPVAEQTKADAQAAVAAAVAAAPTTNKVKDVVRKSTAEGPTKLVWEIADRMKFLNPNVRRVDVVNACIAAGIATHTARTQFQRWFTAQKGATK